jgi:uncharacterized SAM-binding protein YcdF (DUF218 family)
MYESLKYLALPPANFLFVLLVALVFTLCGWKRLGSILMGCGVAIGYLLSTPLVAGGLAKMIETVPAASAASLKAGRPEAIVVLAAGVAPYAPEYAGPTVDDVALQRLRYSVHLWRTLDVPILVSGGPAPGVDFSFAALMKDALQKDFAVPVRWMEDRSRDTYENAIFSAAILRSENIARIVLVTDAAHMARAVAQFKYAGMTVFPAPTAFSAPSRSFPADYLPRFSGLKGSYYAIYEILAKSWYAARHQAPLSAPDLRD